MPSQTAHPRPTNCGPSLDRFLREPEVLRLVGISQMTLYRWERAGRFPMRYKLGPNSVAWKESEVLSWIANRDFAAAGACKKEAQ